MKKMLSRVLGGNKQVLGGAAAGRKESSAAALAAASTQNASLETLEQRQMMALLGVTLATLPIEFYNATGQLRHEASSGSFNISATPTSVFFPGGPRVINASHGDFQIHARLDGTGAFVRGVVAGDTSVIGGVNSNGDDVYMAGSVDVDGNGSINPLTESGVLLTGELYAFGFNNSNGPTDQYDFKFVVTGGLLAPFYAGRDGGITMTSEASTFANNFGVDFRGQAKGSAGPIARPALSSVSGYVYADENNDGIFQGSESAIPGTTVTLTGVNDVGQNISLTQTTDANGYYYFGTLRGGTYQLTETQPAGYLDGKDTIGTPGGSATNDQFSNIVLPFGFNGVHNNFGEILASSISGYVYADADNDGVFDASESPIGGTSVRLTGIDDLSNSIDVTALTDVNGLYYFGGLRPGTYQLNETQPAGYLDGKDTIGTPGGSTADDQFSAIQLPSNFNGVQNNFGEILAGSISGFVYYDSNNDGTFQGGELAIPGTTVMFSGTDDLGNSVVGTAVTDSNGFYYFGGLRPGTYQLNETQPAGYLDGKDTIGTPGGSVANDVFTAIVLPVGFNGVRNNFGEILASSISGYVYADANNDGVFQGSELAIPGTSILLTGVDDLGNSLSLSAITDANGYYYFGGLRPGTYQLNETQPAGYLDGKDTIGTPGGSTSNDQFATIVLPAGFTGVQNNFGEILASSISGYTYYDANNDGTFQGSESPIPGTAVALTGTDDLGNSVSASAVTDANGFYVFGGLRPGTYQLTETQPAAYLDGKDTIGTPGGTTSNDQFSNISLPTNFAGVQNNFGEILASSISGFTYYDANNDGTFQGGEAAISGILITLTGTDDLGNSVSLTTNTNASGFYIFGGLRPGTYRLTETQPAGYLDGKDTIGTPGGITANDQFSSINLPAGFAGVQNNFGEILASSISGFVYHDANNDGTFQGSESPISGVLVTLTGTNDLGVVVNVTANTNASGFYSFGGLRPGVYQLNETQPAAYLDGKDTIGTPGGSTANDQFSGINLPVNLNGVNNNFGEVLPGSLSGYVYCDDNGNCIRNAGEVGIPNVTITLSGINDRGGAVSMTITTNSLGFYSFGGLRPGTYTLTQTQPAGSIDGGDTAGSLGGTAGNDVITGIVVGSGNNGLEYIFGEDCAGSISGTKYRDITGNGLTSDDTGLAGVRIYLDLNNNGSLDSGERSTLTGSNGSFSFTGLSSGNYIVREVVASGWVRTFPTLEDKYSVSVVAGSSRTNINFANFEKDCQDDLVSYSFTATRADGSTSTFGNLRGNTNQGEEIVVTFTLASNAAPQRFTLVSYTAPAASFSSSTASQQRIFEVDTGIFGPGTHTLRVHNPDSNFQNDFVCGAAIDTFGPSGSNIFYTPQGRLISADNDGTNAVVANAGLVSGNVYIDNDNDGVFDSNESGLRNVAVTLTFTENSQTVSITKRTDSRGYYFFSNLKPGIAYTLTEAQPLVYTDGRDTVGSLGGNAGTNDRFSAINVGNNARGINYNFGERITTGTALRSGDTATIGYWQNNNGQALIKSLNGSQNATNLGNWLASNFPNLYGSGAGTNNLANKTNTQVAATFKTRFAANGGPKLEAQMMAVALATYATSSTLAGGNFAASYGFNMSSGGTGTRIMSVGSNGSTFGVANNTNLTVMQYLQIANINASNNGTGWNGNSSARSSANSLFTSINETGDI